MTTRKGALALGTSAVLASSFLSACSSTHTPDYAGVCMDDKTQKRLDDAECEHHTRHGINPMWVYFAMGRRVGPVGGVLGGYQRTLPTDKTYSRGGVVPGGGKLGADTIREGTAIKGANGAGKGSVVRGGFGKGGGGGHGG